MKFLTLFAAGSLLAFNGPQPQIHTDKKPLQETAREGLAAEVLFYDLDGDFIREGRTLTFNITADGAPLFQETIQLQPLAFERVAVEALARNPRAMEVLFDLHQSGGVAIEFEVAIDGKPLETVSFAELRERNGLLIQSESFSPWSGESKLDLLRAKKNAEEPNHNPATEATCEQQCNAEYEDCALYYCGSGTVFCDPCLTILAECLDDCPPPQCQDPKSVSTSTSTQFLGSTYQGLQCMDSIFYGQPSEYYEVLLNNYKETTTRRTEYCDGSVTTEVIGVNYFSVVCYRPTYWQCSFGFGYPSPICY